MDISISRDGAEIGSWPEDQVRSFFRDGQLVATDFYWKEGMSEWKELGSFIKPTPPPAPTPLSEPTVTTVTSVNNTRPVNKTPKMGVFRRGLNWIITIFRWYFAIALLAAVFVGLFYFFVGDGKSGGLLVNLSVSAPIPHDLLKSLNNLQSALTSGTTQPTYNGLVDALDSSYLTNKSNLQDSQKDIFDKVMQNYELANTLWKKSTGDSLILYKDGTDNDADLIKELDSLKIAADSNTDADASKNLNGTKTYILLKTLQAVWAKNDELLEPVTASP